MKYTFWIQTPYGVIVKWTGLTLVQAQRLNSMTVKYGDSNTFTRCGYAEEG